MLILSRSSTCAICEGTFTDGGERAPVITPCYHVFCRACLLRIASHVCPVCRAEYDPFTLHELSVRIDDPQATRDATDDNVPWSNLAHDLNDRMDALPADNAGAAELLADIDALFDNWVASEFPLLLQRKRELERRLENVVRTRPLQSSSAFIPPPVDLNPESSRSPTSTREYLYTFHSRIPRMVPDYGLPSPLPYSYELTSPRMHVVHRPVPSSLPFWTFQPRVPYIATPLHEPRHRYIHISPRPRLPPHSAPPQSSPWRSYELF